MENKYNYNLHKYEARIQVDRTIGFLFRLLFVWPHVEHEKMYEREYGLQRRQQIKNSNRNYYKATLSHTQYTKLCLVVYAQ